MSSYPGLGLCYGAHPGHASHLSGTAWSDVVKQVEASCSKKGVVAVGEVGLDYAVSDTPAGRDKQARLLEAVLGRVRSNEKIRDLPLVQHVREAKVTSMDAAKRCIAILKKVGYPSDHRVYCHCFVGGVDLANLWLAEFPKVKFGLGPKVVTGSDVHPEAQTVFANLSLEQVLVETDAPRLSLGSGGKMTPWSTFTIFRWLAGIRKSVQQPESFGECVQGIENGFMQFFRVPKAATVGE